MPKTDVAAEEAEVHQTLRIVKQLLANADRNGFTSWRWVSKEQYGSEQYADTLSSRASMPAWKQYFISGDKGVKLTEEGYKVAATVKPPTFAGTHLIADCVREYASHLRDVRLKVNHISKVANVGKRYVHALTVDASDDMVASETPCEFRPDDGSSSTRGNIIGQEPDGSVLYVALDCELFESSLPAYLNIDRAFLLLKLSDRLREMKAMPVRMAAALRTQDALNLTPIANPDSLSVAAQLAGLPIPWTRFLWGPPGAGKTYGLGYLVSRLLEIEPNSRTLIVAPSNRAVDVALEQLVGHIERSKRPDLLARRGILRFGYPRKTEILERPELLGSPALDELNHKVKNLSAQTKKAEREHKSEKQIAILRTELLATQEEVKNAVESHIEQCRIVATTVTLGYLASSPISKFKWDNVIIDEVTMVPPAMCAFLASLATKRFLMAGDPQQLGPVYESNSDTSQDVFDWMGRDMFEKCTISSGDGESRLVNLVDKRLARITAQRRCTTAIWKRVEHLYSEVSNRTDEPQRKHLLALPPCLNNAVVLLNTACVSKEARCVEEFSSWTNPFTASLALETVNVIAAEASRRLSVAVIAPYRAQVRLLRKLIRQEQQAVRSPISRIEVDAGTIHQFQGSDADVIIFDMVDSNPRKGVGMLLRGDNGLRMVNVAFTRAKGKLILIADKDWCSKVMRAESNALLKKLVCDPSIARIDILPRPDLNAQVPQPQGCYAEELLHDALCRYSGLNFVSNYVVQHSDGTAMACADGAFPDARLAVYIDGPRWNRLGNTWCGDWRQRHKLPEIGWAFAVFSIAEVHKDADAVAEEVVRIYQLRLKSL